ncbi:hypothetical protein HK102_009784 [Quaeritorhiza haematococci]|nr:hypothetical protein HK102_009784 [Quaeritorhiza haematococci]
MAVVLYQAETGLPVPTFNAVNGSLDDLRVHIQTFTSIPPKAQILLTTTGVQLKPEILADAIYPSQAPKDPLVVFIFNRQVLDPRSSISIRPDIEIEPPVPVDVLAPLPSDDLDSRPSSIQDAFAMYAAAFESHLIYGQAFDVFNMAAQKEITKHANLLKRFAPISRIQLCI